MGSQREKISDVRRKQLSALGPSIEARMRAGTVLRERISRTSHGEWTAPSGRPDPIETLQHSNRGRLRELLPIRYGRMGQSPFAFFRGSAAVMAWDLSKTPATGIRVQACGESDSPGVAEQLIQQIVRSAIHYPGEGAESTT